jgi:septal ring factor EnvC (AmiA/AmiB activator)
MSLAKKIGEMTDALAGKDAALAESAAALAAAQESIEEWKNKIIEMQAAADAASKQHAEEIAAREAALAEAHAANQAAAAEADALRAEIAEAKAALANPAFAAAAVEGHDADGVSVAVGDGDAATSATPHWDEYRGMTGASATKYWRENEEAIRGEMRRL